VTFPRGGPNEWVNGSAPAVLISIKENDMSFRLSSLAALSAAALVTGLVAAPQAQAIVPTSTASVDTDESGVAMQGYDPVAYFADGEPKKGKPEFKLERDGATYYFASAEHLQKFKANPVSYLPQYGGFCAMGTSLGKKFEGDPKLWHIVDQKLYLNVNPDVDAHWAKDISGNVVRANDNWPEIKGKTPQELE
jgi:YHS domain-containing protein